MWHKMKNLFSFFKVGCPWDIRWVHAVNRFQKLEQCCNSLQVMMIEGDISVRGKTVAMAHDSNQEVDLTFDIWIEKIAASKKGAKLDFKEPLAVFPCLKKLQNANLKIPIFLNANILQGPGGKTPKFKAIEFIDLCKKYYPQGILSIDWTTEYLPNAKYTKDMIYQMLDIIKKYNVPITFPIRACYLKSSYSELQPLIQKPNYTITIWNSEPILNDLKDWMKHKLDRNKTFCDLIDNEGNPLRL